MTTWTCKEAPLNYERDFKEAYCIRRSRIVLASSYFKNEEEEEEPLNHP